MENREQFRSINIARLFQEYSSNEIKPSYQVDTKNTLPNRYAIMNNIIEDEFQIQYHQKFVSAEMEFEEMLYENYRIKTKPIIKRYSLYDIAKYHSSHFNEIRQDVFRNQWKYNVDEIVSCYKHS